MKIMNSKTLSLETSFQCQEKALALSGWTEATLKQDSKSNRQNKNYSTLNSPGSIINCIVRDLCEENHFIV